MSELCGQWVALLLDWSIRFGILILLLAVWFWLRPPQSVALRLLLGRLVLLAGLFLPLTPQWISVPWTEIRNSLAGRSDPQAHDSSSEPLDSFALQTPPFSLTDYPKPESVADPRAFEAEAIQASDRQEHQENTLENNPSLAEPQKPLDSRTTFGAFGNMDWGVAAASFWLAGLGFCLLRLFLGAIWLGKFKRECRQASLFMQTEWDQIRKEWAIKREAPVVISDRLRTPALLGGWNPMVVLPCEWGKATPEDRRAVLLHEAAHLCHGDDWALVGEELIRSFFFFHPLVHALIRQIGIDREQRCDARVLQAGVSAQSLASLLLEQFKRLGPGKSVLSFTPLSPFFQARTALNRIENLLALQGTSWGKSIRPWQKAACALTIGLLALTLGGIGAIAARPYGGQPDDQTADTALPLDENQTVPVTGTVLMPNGQPATGVLVRCCWMATGPRQQIETTTNALGQFHFDLLPGNWSFWANDGELGGEGENAKKENFWKISLEKQNSPIQIRLENRRSFQGRLLESETKKPLSGASLYLNDGRVLVTDPQGRWKVAGLKPIRQQAIVVAPNRLRVNFSFDPHASVKEELEIQVPLGQRVTGVVVDSQGKPVPNSWVALLLSGPTFANKGRFETCDHQGRFEFPLTPGYEEQLTAGAPGFQWGGQTDIAKSGEALDLKFQLTKRPNPSATKQAVQEASNRLISGKILAPDGKPIEGAAVYWDRERFREQLLTRTGKDGRYRLHTPDEDGVLIAESKEFAAELIEVDSGANQKIDATLKAGHFLSGRVVDKQGEPIEGATICVGTKDSTFGRLGEKDTTTDAQGEFSLHGLLENSYLSIDKYGYFSKWTDKFTLGNQKYTFQLEADAPPIAGAICCKLVDSEGNPIRHFEITVSAPHRKEPGDPRVEIGFVSRNESLSFSSSDGRFILTGLQAGCYYRIQAYSFGHGPAAVDRVLAVPVDRLEQTADIEIRAEKSKSLKVTAIDSSRRPVPGLRLYLIDEQPGSDHLFSWYLPFSPLSKTVYAARTGSSGTANYRDLSFQEGTMIARAPGFGRVRIPWRKGETELVITMEPEAILEGELTGGPEIGSEVDAVLVSKNNEQIYFPVLASNRWQFKIKELPTGTWQIKYGWNFSYPKKDQLIKFKSGETKKWNGKWEP